MVQKIWSVDGIDRLSKILSVGIVLFSFVAVHLGFKEFHLWPQVEYLYNEFGGVSWRQLYEHPHAHRYMLVGWIYDVEETIGLGRHILFSYVCVIILTSVSLMSAKLIAWRAESGKVGILTLVALVYYFSLSWFMNGRLVIGLFGVALLIAFICFFRRGGAFNAVLLFTVALIVSGVTSGIFLSVAGAAFAAVFFALLIDAYRFRWGLPWRLYLTLGLVALFFMPLVQMLFFKNLSYYGGSVVAATDHGIGKIISMGAEFTNRQKILNLVWLCACVVMLVYLVSVYSIKSAFAQFDAMLLIAMLVLITLSTFAYSVLYMTVVFSYFVSSVVIVHFVKMWNQYA